ncbi:MAG TPA: 3-oxoacyl-[acyl-carrier-protein] synthase III C-terminal domain-containing protein [Verrucomicrobiota bacterium]|nr:stilbene synthase [Verrucomicrobiales bacterium]HRI12421.1 3-oxoacyl-[acyl-carrier-protein] synthase III C-terminal domain-containing protein [Verrucomicrobiota bacterium]
MFLNGIGTAAPSQRYTQLEGWDVVRQTEAFSKLRSRSQAILRKVLLGVNGVEARHLALDSLAEAFALDPDTLHARFARNAPDLATEAARRALAEARLETRSVDALLVATCTGYLCPGLTSYVAERLGLRSDVNALDLVGLGCGAALPSLQTAEVFLRSGHAQNVLVVCVEVCSAAMFLDDDPGVLISACLFGDGAAAVVASASPAPHRRSIGWKRMVSRLSPENRERLRFETRGGMLRNVLTLEVPDVAAIYAGEVFDSLLQDLGMAPQDVREWILHAGGRDVLTALQRRLGLADQDLRHSAGVLREFGNLSSASVLFALASALDEGAPGGRWWMTSFGAGFSCHGALIEVG